MPWKLPPPEDPAAQVEGLKAALNEQHQALLRAVAEAENVRRRAQREVSDAYGRGQRQIARELLASLDSLELGLDSADGATAESLLEGQRATLRQLQKSLEQFGVEAVDALGEPFDPERHEAVGMQPSDSVDPECVISVMQKGYLMQGRLLRARPGWWFARGRRRRREGKAPAKNKCIELRGLNPHIGYWRVENTPRGD